MAIFRNKEGDLPPLIPTGREKKPTTELKQPRPAESAGLPELPKHVAPPIQPPAPIEAPQPVVAAPEPVVPQAPAQESVPQPATLQPQVEQAPQQLPDAGPQFDQQVERVKRPESVDGMQQEQPRQQEAEGGMRRRRRKKQSDDQQAQTLQQQVAPQADAVKTAERIEIEKILSDGMSELYQTMTPQQQEAFRLKGDEAATAIEKMVDNLKASTRKVVGLIRDWLQFIPGVNKYFLEQESKLKTDEIMKYQRKVEKERKSRVTL